MKAPADRKIAQDAAEERVEHFRKALGPFVGAVENTRMAMIFTDAQVGRHPVVFANDSFLALTGFGKEQILGKRIHYLLGDLTDEDTLSAIESALDEGRVGVWEAHCRRVDGSTYLATVFLSPVIDDAGIPRQHFLCFMEVSGRIDRLLDQRKTFSSLYERAPGFIATLEGTEHRFSFANASYRSLVERDDLLGKTVTEVLPELIDQGIIALLDGVFKTGVPFVGKHMPMSFSVRAKDTSKLRYLNFIYQPIRDADGVIFGIFVEGHDVTAERAAEEQLATLRTEVVHASRVNAMGMMAATLAHELNQPLTAVTSYAGASIRLIDPESLHASKLFEALRGIEEAGQRAGDIIRNLRELTRRGQTSRVTFSLQPAFAECIRLIRAGGCEGVTIEDLTPKGLKAVGDRIQIQQVLINLVRNACEAVAGMPDATVTVDAVARGNQIVVSVMDVGPGLPPQAAEDIFVWTDSSKDGGMGLGLSIARTIVEGHGGEIWLERTSDVGSQFCFSIPTAAPDAASDNAH